MATCKDMETRHGAIYATGEVVLALKNWAVTKMNDASPNQGALPEASLIDVITIPTWLKILEIVPKLSSASMFKGLAGEWTRKAACRMIHRLSEAQFPLWRKEGDTSSTSPPSSSSVKQSWLNVINDLLHHADPLVAALAIDALPHFCSSYVHPATLLCEADPSSSSSSSRPGLISHYREIVKTALQEKSRQGHCLALAALPKFMFEGHLSSVVETLSMAASIPAEATAAASSVAAKQLAISPTTTPFSTAEWADARRDAIFALAEIVVKVGFQRPEVTGSRHHPKNEDVEDAALTPALFHSVCDVVLASLSDYTTDSRGDVGSLVREAGIVSLQKIVCFASSSSSSSSSSPSSTSSPSSSALLKPEFVSSVITGIVQQSCEKINRTRAIAGKAFAAILWNEPEVPHIPDVTRLRSVFTRQVCGIREENVGCGDETLAIRVDWSCPSVTFPLFRYSNFEKSPT